jgi:general secretion pathway protein I
MRLKERGFSLLETLVSVAILSLALLALLQIRTDAIGTIGSLESRIERAATTRTALLLLEDLNPMAEPDGERHIGRSLRVRWSARPLTKSVRTIGQEVPDGDFNVALFDLEVIAETDGIHSQAFHVQKLGWRRL